MHMMLEFLGYSALLLTIVIATVYFTDYKGAGK